MKFVIEEMIYPSGKKYFNFYLNGVPIGATEKVEGGYLIWGKRKPRKTEELAAFQMLFDHSRKAAKEMQKWDDLTAEFIKDHPELLNAQKDIS